MKKNLFYLSLIFIFVLLAGCGQQTNEMDETQAFQDLLDTAIAQTLSAEVGDTPQPVENTPTIEAAPAEETQAATSTLPPIPTLTATQVQAEATITNTPYPTPCYAAELIDETIPDGTRFKVGDGFVKSWTVKNVGTCSWSKKFRWMLVEGDPLKGESDKRLSNVDIMPGESVRIDIEMAAPQITGHYHSVYKIFTEEGGEVTPNGFWIDVWVDEK